MPALLAILIVLGQATTPAPAPAAPVLSQRVPSAAATFVGQTIVEAVALIDGAVSTDPTLADLIETRPGTPLSMASVRETIAHLYSLRRFQDVAVEAEPVPGGVRVRFVLSLLQTVEEIDFRGRLGLGERELRRVVVERFGTAPPAARASAAAELLQRHYFEQGHLDAAIRPMLEERPGGRTVLTFEVQSGPQARVRNVRIIGDPKTGRDAFLRQIHADPGRVYKLLEVQDRLSDYVARLRREGRYEASGSHRMEARSDDGESVDLAVTIELGPEVSVRYEGDPLPQNRLDELVPVRREGSVDVDIIEDSEQRIAAYLNQQGYWKAVVSSTRRSVDGRLEIVFNVARGPQYRIEGGVEVGGNASVPLVDLRPALPNLGAGEVFVASNLDAAVAAVRGIYLRRGFAQVKVDASVNEVAPPKPGEGRVKPAIRVTEGPLMRVGEVRFAGNAAIRTEELGGLLSIRPGEPYFEPQVIRDRETVLREYLNRGFESATVTVTPQVAAARVDLQFTVVEGTQVFVDHVLIIGNVKTRVEVIQRELGDLRSGAPLGLETLFEARRRLSELGLFRRVRIDEIVHGESGRRDLLVTVEESPATSIGYGGGLEINNRLDTSGTTPREEIELAPRGFFEIGRRNLGGKNRTVNLYTRLSLRSDTDPETTGLDAFQFPEYRVVGTFREPKTFGWDADVTITAVVEQGIRSTFNFARKGINAELARRLSPRTRASGRYTLGTTRIFDLREDPADPQNPVNIDRVFPQVRLSAFSGSILHDRRDDQIDPARGYLVSAEGTLAARSLGGQVGFIKSYLQGQGYRQLPFGRRVVLAGRLALGLADGFPRETPSGVVEDLPASERFFAGGDTTMRGFALDSVGTERTISDTGVPRGGNGLVLANLELRFPVWKDLGAAVFTDGGNVFERVTQIELGQLRWSVGIGLRYRTPVGPLRFDVGFKLDPREFRGELEPRRAFHFSFGQAF